MNDSEAVVCGNCGESVSSSIEQKWSYCPECGMKLSGRRAKPPKPGERYAYKPVRVFMEGEVAKQECESCGNTVDLDRHYCSKCGSRFLPANPEMVMQVVLGTARYLGGCSTFGAPRNGGLAFTQGGVFFDGVKLDMPLVKSVEVGGGQVAKSKVGAVVAFGVLGGLAAKGSMDRTEIAVQLHSGDAACFAIEKASPFEVRAKLLPLLRAVGVPFGDEIDEQAGAPDAIAGSNAPRDLVDELERLARLHESGFLSAAEVAAAKAKLLDSSER